MKHFFLLSMLILSSIPAFAAVPPQTTKDRVEGNRLVINDKPVFISGMNIAWDRFANDVGDQKISSSFVNYFKQIKGAGGNAVRWWLHTDAQNCPKIDNDGKVTSIGSKTIENIRDMLDSAYAYGIVVSLTLFSFDLLQGDNKSNDVVTRNKKFLTVPANLDTYIQNGLRPILQAVGNHPAIMCWEVFNEPEGMSSDAGGWSLPEKIPMSDVLRFTAKIAAEVHSSTNKMASTGIHEFGKMQTWYSNAKLKTASGNDDELAYLDFYMAHYYPEYMGTSGSPFHHPASYWGMDRPILIGEFPAKSWGPGTGYTGGNENGNGALQGTAMTIVNAYKYAYDNGYLGALSWSMNQAPADKFGDFNTTKLALENLYNEHKTDIEIKEVEIVVPTGDLAMKLAITGLPVLNADWSELGTNKDINFSGKSNLTFEMYIVDGSGTNLDINVVLKVGNAWDWTPAEQTIKLNNYEQGKWVTVTVPISSFGNGNLSQVKSILFQYGATSSPYNGTIHFDNIKVDNTVISDFDDNKAWDLTADNSAVSIVSRIGSTTSIKPNEPKLDISTLDFSKAKIYNASGKRVFASSFAELKNGIYIVKINGVAKKFVVK